MNCETFEERIHQLLDRRECLAADEQLAAHAAACEQCAASWQTYQFFGTIYPVRPLGTADGKSFATRVIEQYQMELLAAETLVADSAHADSVSADFVSADFVTAAPPSADPLSCASMIDPSSEPLGAVAQPASLARPRHYRIQAIVGLALGLILVVTTIWNLKPGHPEAGQTASRTPTVEPGTRPVAVEAAVPEIWVTQGDVIAWPPFSYDSLTALGGGSLAVVQPLALPLHVAYDLLWQNLWGGRNSIESIQDEERWQLILENVA